MEIRFQGKQGLRKIRKKEYALQESATGKEIDRSVEFQDTFLPGQKVTMSVIFKKDAAERSTQSSAHCPKCEAVTIKPGDADILW